MHVRLSFTYQFKSYELSNSANKVNRNKDLNISLPELLSAANIVIEHAHLHGITEMNKSRIIILIQQVTCSF